MTQHYPDVESKVDIIDNYVDTEIVAIDGKLGTEYADVNGLPEVDNVRAHLFKVGGLGGGRAQKDLTFINLAAPADLFTVTGDVIIKIIAHCTTLVASAAAGNVEVGTAASTGAILPTTLGTNLDAGEIWHDAAPDSAVEALSTMKEYIIVGSADIIITPSAQIDSGVITFYCFWTQLNSIGNVVSA